MKSKIITYSIIGLLVAYIVLKDFVFKPYPTNEKVELLEIQTKELREEISVKLDSIKLLNNKSISHEITAKKFNDSTKMVLNAFVNSNDPVHTRDSLLAKFRQYINR
jgi:cystathionine beta-lyase family protein involved in aluminum resistance